MEDKKEKDQKEVKPATPIAGESSETKPEEEKKKTYTEEEVEAIKKKMQSDSEKGVQKIISEKKTHESEARIYKSVLDAVKQVSDDQSSLVAIYEKDPKVGQVILEKYYDGMSLDKFKEQIQYKENLSDPEVFARRLETEKQKAIDSMKIDQAKDAFIKELEMSEDEKAEFEKAFEERKSLRSFNASNVEQHLERAYREIDKTDLKSLKSKVTIAKAIATGE
jgi:hypothetical protein